MTTARKRDLTTPDLVLLSLLAERPMHGYEANAELERRQVRDWAGISRPQVYYSLEKLARLGLVRAAESGRKLTYGITWVAHLLLRGIAARLRCVYSVR